MGGWHQLRWQLSRLLKKNPLRPLGWAGGGREAAAAAAGAPSPPGPSPAAGSAAPPVPDSPAPAPKHLPVPKHPPSAAASGRRALGACSPPFPCREAPSSRPLSQPTGRIAAAPARASRRSEAARPGAQAERGSGRSSLPRGRAPAASGRPGPPPPGPARPCPACPSHVLSRQRPASACALPPPVSCHPGDAPPPQ